MNRYGPLWANALTVIFIGLTCVSVAAFVVVAAAPGLLPAQFQPPTPIVVPTLPPATPQPTAPVTLPTALPTLEPPVAVPTDTPAPTATPEAAATPGKPYALQSGIIVAQGDIYGLACGWMGIAGQVFDLNGNPTQGLIVRLNGGGFTDLDVFTGDSRYQAYGPAGYEFKLSDAVKATNGLYTIQLLDEVGQPVSDLIVVNTTDDCAHNLYMVNFVQVE